MSTQLSQSRTGTVEENAAALWKAAQDMNLSRTDFVKACLHAAAETTVDPVIPTPEPDIIPEDGPTEGPHSTYTPGR